MSFQAYIDNIQAKTGKTPADFKALAEQKGLLGDGVKTMQIVNWLKEDFGLGRGHAMAIVVTLRGGHRPDEGLEDPGRRASRRQPDHTANE
jgi:hypothetical protein